MTVVSMQALICLGEPGSLGQELIHIAAGDGQNYNYTGLTPYLTPHEIQVIK